MVRIFNLQGVGNSTARQSLTISCVTSGCKSSRPKPDRLANCAWKATRHQSPPPKRLFNLIQRLPLSFRHESKAYSGRQQCTTTEQEINRVATLRQQHRGRKGYQEVSCPIAPVRKVCSRRSSPLRLAFCHVDLDPDGPGDTEDGSEDVDRDDNQPSSRSGCAVHGISCVQPANDEHCSAES